MIKFLVLITLFLELFGQAQTSTTIRFTVIDEHNTPISGVTYVIRLGDSEATFISDPEGVTIVTVPDPVLAVFIESASHDGRDLLLDQNMPDGTIRVAAIPQQQRPVVLFLDQDDMLHMTPESLFAGIEPTSGLPSTVVPAVNGSLPPLPTDTTFPATVIAAQTHTQPEPSDGGAASVATPIAGASPQQAPGAARGVPVWCLALAACVLLAMGAVGAVSIRRERQHKHRALETYRRNQPAQPDEK